MNEARQTFEAIARANGGKDFSLKQDGRYAVQNIQSRWTYFKLGWEAGTKREQKLVAALESVEQPAQQEPVKFNCTVVDDAHPEGVPLSQWGKQQKQKPFCYHDGRNIVGKEFADHSDVFPLYTRPYSMTPLTDDRVWLEYMQLWPFRPNDEPTLAKDILRFARAIEAAHGIEE